ncbi:Glutathione-regulated potassium-efflux system protein KefC [Aquimixticola soesokkakensis]|uniref:Glutathione-regulated potassium-efflux system protein KefC n=1 Tax=Aquimixticola soesokkakensis TaxID=1519096 RepID=A0A1Y5SA36_9RHOB|nr:monovalent cation:proton antiporter-2 (CPA2) family protein [Aquimixticola soesokkakensis]SLN35919.1 Glutathione-regulated potassium-efflux system protein KefC [Aquimixticola soesokkakensis]
MEGFLFQATIYLAATVISVPIATRLGLGSVLGYLLAGIVIGPVLHLVGHSETHDLQHFAEFGVVMMLFLIGLELTPRALWDMRHRLLGLGGLQLVLTVGAVAWIADATGQTLATGIVIGMILALSSTAVVLQTLSEKKLMGTPGGRSAFSILLSQDIAVIPMLAIIPLLGGAMDTVRFADDGSIQRGVEASTQELSLVANLPGWGVTLVTLGAVATIILAGIFLVRPLFRFIQAANLRELYTATALLIVVGIAALMNAVGLSPALGTFLAGVVLANTEFRHELESSIEPFKGLLLGLFFIAVGAGINFAILWDEPLKISAAVITLMLVKGAILYGLSTLFKLRGRDRWLVTLSLAGAGEFGMVLISFASQSGVLSTALAERGLLLIALSLLLTPLAFLLQDFISKRLRDTDSDDLADEIDDQQPVIIAGIGRFGQVVNRLLQGSGLSTTVLDADLKTIQTMRKFGIKGYFGDPTRPDLLHAAGLHSAKVLVAALDDPEMNLKLVEYARKQRPDLHIVARARDRLTVYQLRNAGADDIVREVFDSSLRAGRYVLEQMGMTQYEASETATAYYKHDRHMLRELADLWDPKVPLGENAAYIQRSKELALDLENAIMTTLDTSRENERIAALKAAETAAAQDAGKAAKQDTKKAG